LRSLATARHFGWYIASWVFLVHCPSLAAETPVCSSSAKNWVRVSIEATEFPDLPSQLLEHLRVELALHGIAVCPLNSMGEGAPLAVIRIVRKAEQRFGIEVEVDDAVTEKRTTRILDLKRLPQDTHPVTIALGAAELLRASWAEIKLQRQTASAWEVSASVRETVDAKMENRKPRGTMGLQLAAEEFSRGLRQGGADIATAFEIASPWSLTFRLGARQALATRVEDGVIRANAWLIGTGGLLRVTQASARATVAVTAHIDCVRQQFFAEPVEGASAATLSGTGYLASLGAFGGIELSPSLQVNAEVDAGTVMKGVSARDAGRVVVAMNGPWVGATLGLSLRTW